MTGISVILPLHNWAKHHWTSGVWRHFPKTHIVAQVTPAVSRCVAHAHGVGSLSWLSKHSPLPARSLRCSLPVWKLWTSVCKVALELVSANWTRTSHMHTSITQQTSNTVCSVNTAYVKSVPGYCATSLLYATGLVTSTLECTLISGCKADYHAVPGVLSVFALVCNVHLVYTFYNWRKNKLAILAGAIAISNLTTLPTD